MKNKWTFVSLLQGDDPVEFDDFKGAWEQMKKWVKDHMDNLNYQILETTIWIERPSGTPLFFYDAKDLAYEMGIMP